MSEARLEAIKAAGAVSPAHRFVLTLRAESRAIGGQSGRDLMQRRHSFVLVLTLAAIATSTVRSSTLPQAKPASTVDATIPRLDHQTLTLKNGFKVILSEDKRLPMVAVNLWYHVGPANEIPGRTGFAHLFEHMMFQGSKHVAADTHFKLLEAAGASDINGTTDFDRTNYFETVPANQLELALWIESDRMGYLLDVLDEQALANQRDVVRNERRQSLENQPYGVAEESLYQALYPKGHAYHGVVIGSHADLAAAELKDVQQFFRQYYTPNNASLAIVVARATPDFEVLEVVNTILLSLSIGSNVSGESVGAAPPNFVVQRHVPQLAVLQRTTAFVTHGGMNSVSESLYYGVPVVVIPQMNEQVIVGRRVEELGAGLYVAKKDMTAERLRESVRRLLDEDRFRRQAVVVGESFQTAGGVARAAEAILAFTRTRAGAVAD